MGVIILFFGFQLRAVDTFVLNERVSSFVNERIAAEQPVQQAGYYDAYWGFDDPAAGQPEPLPRYRRITPPRWLGWSFLSIGAILVCTAPAFR